MQIFSILLSILFSLYITGTTSQTDQPQVAQPSNEAPETQQSPSEAPGAQESKQVPPASDSAPAPVPAPEAPAPAPAPAPVEEPAPAPPPASAPVPPPAPASLAPAPVEPPSPLQPGEPAPPPAPPSALQPKPAPAVPPTPQDGGDKALKENDEKENDAEPKKKKKALSKSPDKQEFLFMALVGIGGLAVVGLLIVIIIWRMKAKSKQDEGDQVEDLPSYLLKPATAPQGAPKDLQANQLAIQKQLQRLKEYRDSDASTYSMHDSRPPTSKKHGRRSFGDSSYYEGSLPASVAFSSISSVRNSRSSAQSHRGTNTSLRPSSGWWGAMKGTGNKARGTKCSVAPSYADWMSEGELSRGSYEI